MTIGNKTSAVFKPRNLRIEGIAGMVEIGADTNNHCTICILFRFGNLADIAQVVLAKNIEGFLFNGMKRAGLEF